MDILAHKHSKSLEKFPSNRSNCQSPLQNIATPPPWRPVLSLRRIEKPSGQIRWVGMLWFNQVSETQQISVFWVFNSQWSAGKVSGFAKDLAFITKHLGIIFGLKGDEVIGILIKLVVFLNNEESSDPERRCRFWISNEVLEKVRSSSMNSLLRPWKSEEMGLEKYFLDTKLPPRRPLVFLSIPACFQSFQSVDDRGLTVFTDPTLRKNWTLCCAEVFHQIVEIGANLLNI